jgi:hypothetical protein
MFARFSRRRLLGGLFASLLGALLPRPRAAAAPAAPPAPPRRAAESRDPPGDESTSFYDGEGNFLYAVDARGLRPDAPGRGSPARPAGPDGGTPAAQPEPPAPPPPEQP